MAGDQCHVDDADDEGWDRDNKRKSEPVEEILPFAKLHSSGAFLKRWRVINGRIEWW